MTKGYFCVRCGSQTVGHSKTQCDLVKPPEENIPEVETKTFYRAFCRCGWQAEWMESRRAALMKADDHYECIPLEISESERIKAELGENRRLEP